MDPGIYTMIHDNFRSYNESNSLTFPRESHTWYCSVTLSSEHLKKKKRKREKKKVSREDIQAATTSRVHKEFYFSIYSPVKGEKMRVNFDIVGSSVDKSRAIYLNFLHVFRFNIESLVHAPWRSARFSRRGLETLIEDRWGRVREIFEIIYRRTRKKRRNAGHSLAY